MQRAARLNVRSFAPDDFDILFACDADFLVGESEQTRIVGARLEVAEDVSQSFEGPVLAEQRESDRVQDPIAETGDCKMKQVTGTFARLRCLEIQTMFVWLYDT